MFLLNFAAKFWSWQFLFLCCCMAHAGGLQQRVEELYPSSQESNASIQVVGHLNHTVKQHGQSSLHRRQLQDTTVKTVQVTSNGNWFWFADPRAVYYKGKNELTYVGWIAKNGDIQVGGVDLKTGKALSSKKLARAKKSDDYLNPSLIALNDGRLIAFYTRAHNGFELNYRISQKPEDISSWGSAKKFPSACANCSFAYPVPLRVTGQPNSLYIILRHHDRAISFSSSTDNGGSWTTPVKIVEAPSEKPDAFFKVAIDSRNAIHVAFNLKVPTNEPDNRLYYGKFSEGCWFRANGVQIKCLTAGPLAVAEAEQVYDAADATGRSWVYDMSLTSAGRPIITYAAFPSPTNHVYRSVRWTGKVWRDSIVTLGGGYIWTPPPATPPSKPYYSGGIVIDRRNADAVYLSSQVNGFFRIERWTTSNWGKSWTFESVVGTSGGRSLIRPVSVANAPGQMVLWVSVKSYTSNSAFDTAIEWYHKP